MATKHDFFAAVKAGDRDRVEALIQQDPGFAAATSEEGVSGLLLALYHGHSNLALRLRAERGVLDVFESAALGDAVHVEAIVTAHPHRANAFSLDGFTPLTLASFFGQPTVVQVLLTHGADPNQPARHTSGVHPIHSACAHADRPVALEIATLLLDAGAVPNVTQAGGWTPLHQAAAHGHTPLVRLLLSHGADALARAEDRRTPTEMAAEQGHAETLEVLHQHTRSA